jgi:hypothetical protein
MTNFVHHLVIKIPLSTITSCKYDDLLRVIQSGVIFAPPKGTFKMILFLTSEIK